MLVSQSLNIPIFLILSKKSCSAESRTKASREHSFWKDCARCGTDISLRSFMTDGREEYGKSSLIHLPATFSTTVAAARASAVAVL